MAYVSMHVSESPGSESVDVDIDGGREALAAMAVAFNVFLMERYPGLFNEIQIKTLEEAKSSSLTTFLQLFDH